MRDLIRVTENTDYGAAHHDLARSSCASAIRSKLADGQVSPLTEVHHPAGDPVRRSEAMPRLSDKFHTLTRTFWPEERRNALLAHILDVDALSGTSVNDFLTSVS